LSTSNFTALTSGVAYAAQIPVYAGDMITKVAFRTGGQAAVTPTHWWVALYNSSGTLLAQSADQTTTAIGAYSLVNVSLSAVQTIVSNSYVYAVIMVTAATVPSLIGMSGGTYNGFLSSINMAETFGSALTATAPSTITSSTATGSLALCALT
jgi:hypothetical protein